MPIYLIGLSIGRVRSGSVCKSRFRSVSNTVILGPIPTVKFVGLIGCGLGGLAGWAGGFKRVMDLCWACFVQKNYLFKTSFCQKKTGWLFNSSVRPNVIFFYNFFDKSFTKINNNLRLKTLRLPITKVTLSSILKHIKSILQQFNQCHRTSNPYFKV